MSPANSVLRTSLFNLGWLSFGRVFGDLATFVFLVIISRWHGEEGLGSYAFAMGFAVFYAILTDIGLYIMFLKEGSKPGVVVTDLFGKVFSLSLLLSVFASILLAITSLYAPFPPESVVFVVVIGVYQIIARLAEACSTVFLVMQQTHVSGLLEVASKSLAALLGTLLVVAGVSLPIALWVLPCVAFVHLLVAYRLISVRLGRPPLGLRPADVRALLRDVRPYVPTVLQVPIYARADVITLGFLLGTVEVGVYSAAFRIVYLLIVFSTLASFSLFPVASRLFETSRADFQALYDGAFRVIVLATLPTAVGLWLIAPDLIVAIFGPAFADSGTVLRALSGIAILFPIRGILSILLTSAGRQPARALAEWLGAPTMWVACLLLIPLLGEAGAALAMLLAEGVMVGFMLVRLVPLLGWPQVGNRPMVAAIGSAALAVPHVVAPELPLVVLIGASILIYLAVLALSVDIRTTEYRLLRDLLVPGQPRRSED